MPVVSTEQGDDAAAKCKKTEICPRITNDSSWSDCLFTFVGLHLLAIFCSILIWFPEIITVVAASSFEGYRCLFIRVRVSLYSLILSLIVGITRVMCPRANLRTPIELRTVFHAGSLPFPVRGPDFPLNTYKRIMHLLLVECIQDVSQF